MVGLETWERLAARRIELTGPEPIVIDGESTLRYIESGSVALFCAEAEDGVPVGPRRFIGRLGSGQSVVSVPSEHGRGLRFLVVPIQNAVIREIPLDAYHGEMMRNGSPLSPLIDGWVEFLAGLLSRFTPPKLSVRASGDREVQLEKGQALRAERKAVVWANVQSGQVMCMGRGEIVMQPTPGFIPLAGGMWLEAAGAGAGLRTHSTETMADVHAIASGIAKLHALVLYHLFEIGEEESAQEFERLRERDRRQADQHAEALSDLVAVFEPRSGRVVRETPLLSALTAVGETMGITILPPGKSELLDPRADPLASIARASRIRTRRVTLSGKWWKKDCGSVLGFSNDEEKRPLAVLRSTRLKYEIYDPATGRRTPVDERSAAQLAPEAVMLYRPLPDGGLGLIDLFKFSLSGRRRDLTLVILTGMGATLLAMITPAATALLMDYAIPDANVGLLLQLGAGLLAAAMGQVIFNLSQGFVLLRIGIGVEADSQSALWDRLLRLQPSFFRQYSSGDLQSRVMAVTEVGRELSGATLATIFSSFMALLNLGLLYYYSTKLSLLAIGIAFVVVLFSLSFGAVIRKKFQALLELEGLFFGMVIQLINGVSKLKVAGAEARAYAHWLKRYSKNLKLWSQADYLQDCVGVFNTVLPTLSSVFLFFFAFDMLMDARQPGAVGGISLGIFLAFNAAFATFIAGVTSLSSEIVGFMDTAVQGKRIRPILQAEPEVDESKADPGRLTGRFDLNKVEFRYEADGPKILDGVSLRAEPGEFIALVGPSGSGKSTLFRMLLGFENPSSGEVSYDGQDVASLDVLAVRRQLGVVLQGGSLDAGSIYENIACGNVITLDEAWAAAEDSGIADEVREMPMGLHTVVSVGGGNLSGGQRQRLLIARALSTRPRILLFDEATSALDNRTQAIVSESLERLKVTRFVIAHRLSTIRNADRIYVLDGGKIVEEGRFEELMKNDGLFHRLMSRQMA